MVKLSNYRKYVMVESHRFVKLGGLSLSDAIRRKWKIARLLYAREIKPYTGYNN